MKIKEQIKAFFTPKEKEQNKDTDKTLLWISIAAVIVILGVWLFTYFTLINVKTVSGEVVDFSERGTFGDMFGGVNALYSGLAFAGIIITILLQRKELGLQRDELKETRKEFQIQNETLKTQRFENTFFNLLNSHHQIVNNIDHELLKPKKVDVEPSAKDKLLRHIAPTRPFDSMLSEEEKTINYDRVVISGRDVFEYNYTRLKQKLSQNPDVIKSYESIYNTIHNDFGLYFRNLYSIVKFIDKTEFYTLELVKRNNENIADDKLSELYEQMNFDKKYEYVSMLRSQLSNHELLWLFYNCMSAYGEKFKPLIVKYKMLKNLPKENLHNQQYIDSFTFDLSGFE